MSRDPLTPAELAEKLFQCGLKPKAVACDARLTEHIVTVFSALNLRLSKAPTDFVAVRAELARLWADRDCEVAA